MPFRKMNNENAYTALFSINTFCQALILTVAPLINHFMMR